MTIEKKLLCSFSVERLQFINQSSNLTQELPPEIDDKQLLSLYEKMCRVRKFDEKAVNLQRTGRIGTFPAATGQEAVGVGAGTAMKTADVFVPYYRDQALMLERGVKMEDLYAVWGGYETGNSGTSMHNRHDFPICVPIATQYLHAAGIAYAMQVKGEKNAVLTTGGEGSTSQGDFYEAINVAGVSKLPMVFLINNNQWAISVPRASQSGTNTFAQKGIAAGIKCLQVDGNDVVAVHVAVTEALQDARDGKGATLIEAETYRLCDHTTADDASRYVDDSIKAAWKREPIMRMAYFLKKKGLWDADKEKALQERLGQEIVTAVEAYESMTQPKTTEMMDDLYAEIPHALSEQYQELERL